VCVKGLESPETKQTPEIPDGDGAEPNEMTKTSDQSVQSVQLVVNNGCFTGRFIPDWSHEAPIRPGKRPVYVPVIQSEFITWALWALLLHKPVLLVFRAVVPAPFLPAIGL